MTKRSDRVNSAEAVADLVKRLAGKGLELHVRGVDLSKLVSQPSSLLDHLQAYGVLQNPEDIKRLLADLLQAQLAPDTFERLQDTQLLYDALFDQTALLARYTPEHPLSIVLFRGGRGAAALTALLSKLPNLSLRIVLGATDDGRSWYIAAKDFNATGVPDAGKALLDLARDDAVKRFLEYRLCAESGRDLRSEFKQFVAVFEDEVDNSLNPQFQRLHDLSKPIAPDKRRALYLFLSSFQNRYATLASQADPSAFSFVDMPLRSLVLVGAAWHFDGVWQRALDEVGKLLEIEPHRVLFPTIERLHLTAMTADGTIYFAETGINEHPKRSDFIGLWLMSEKLDIEAAAVELRDQGILLETLLDEDLSGMSASDRALQAEIRATTRKISDPSTHKLQQTAAWLAQGSCSAQDSKPGPAAALPETENALRTADVIVYAPTTLESNIGSALIVPGVQRAIRANAKAAKLHFVNPTIENDKADTTAFDMIARLVRYGNGEQAYAASEINWNNTPNVNYAIGIGDSYPPKDNNKRYIPFVAMAIHRGTRGQVIPIEMDIESKVPRRNPGQDHDSVINEYGLYDPEVVKEVLIALLGIKITGFEIHTCNDNR